MKNVLNYFVRKAFGFKSTATAEDKTLYGHLLRIRQNIQGVYDWLYGRLSGSVDGTVPKRMPMTEAVTSADGHELHIAKAWNSDTLLAHLRLLDGRKISNGYQDGTPADDGLPDGVSLARLLCDSSLQPTELVDDNVGWVLGIQLDKALASLPNVYSLHLGCVAISNMYSTSVPFPRITHLELPHLKRAIYCCIDRGMNLTELNLPELEIYQGGNSTTNGFLGMVNGDATITKLYAPKLKEFYFGRLCNNCASLKEVVTDIEVYDEIGGYLDMLPSCPSVEKIVFGKLRLFKMQEPNNRSGICRSTNLLHLEVGEGTCVSLDFRSWSPTLDESNLSLFLDNFLHFIAERVAEGNYTLTLSAAVYAALEEQEGQTILALLNTKGWTVASA